MAKKRTALSGLNDTLFQGIDPYGRKQDQHPESVATLALQEILPDLTQPRRLLPPPLAQALQEEALRPEEVMRRWVEAAADEQLGGVIQRKLDDLRQLATSIEQHGLINPITVRQPADGEILPSGVKYLVVTGERRYWAHVYLNHLQKKIQAGDVIEDPAQIKAIIANTGISVRAHQLLENLMREDINALEKAQGFWALRYELSGVNYSSPEVGDNRPRAQGLVPWSRVEAALGISKRYRIFITSVLNLIPEAQTMVAEYNLAEMTIRPITQKLKSHPPLQLEALRQLVAWQTAADAEDGPAGGVVASVKQLVDDLLAAATAANTEAATSEVDRSEVSIPSSRARRFRSRLQGMARYLSKMKQDEQAALLDELIAVDSPGLYTDLVDLHQRLTVILAVLAEQTDEDPGEAVHSMK